ncbi:early nodulin-like protein 18 [Phragmites australis]|uniref:early nodulin-like protein 18 n=1 Tax=Phragmites australis TaxID=29695 RepID=UPI002D79A9E5|nr:early nodulin-like protein 18 [Phragmites australis]
MAKCNASYGLGLACFAVAVAMAGATRFQVGGTNGWSVPVAGAESFNTWAERTMFQIGDSLEFVYPKDQDSVLLVEPADYNACNTSSYVRKFDDGDTVFTLDRSGVLFFISGVEANCRANEKLIIMVLAAGRNGTGGAPAPSTAPPQSASSPPPTTSSPPTPSPPAPAPKAPATASPPSPSSAPPPAASAPTTTPSTPAPSSSSPPAPGSSAPAPTSTPPSPPAGAPQAPTSASASSPAPSAHGTANSTGTSPPPSGSNDRNGAALTVATGLVSSFGASVVGYAMLAL